LHSAANVERNLARTFSPPAGVENIFAENDFSVDCSFSPSLDKLFLPRNFSKLETRNALMQVTEQFPVVEHNFPTAKVSLIETIEEAMLI
jgi:hypothetical protein